MLKKMDLEELSLQLEQNMPANAIKHYEKFLDLWKNPDLDIAEVEDATERLAWLKSH